MGGVEDSSPLRHRSQALGRLRVRGVSPAAEWCGFDAGWPTAKQTQWV